jgi:hypothetical protein
MSSTYPPYVNAYGNLSKLFAGIKNASVPPKFTHDFMTTALGLKSTSYRAMIPLLKRLGFWINLMFRLRPIKSSEMMQNLDRFYLFS